MEKINRAATIAHLKRALDKVQPEHDDERGTGYPNAHLIAAAPEMYEAIEHILKEICEGDFVKHSKDAIKKLNNALTKARGES
jgi:hypothetical protein